MPRSIISILFASLLTLITAHPLHADTRKDFLKLIDRPRVPLDPQITSLPTTDLLAEYHFTYAAAANDTVPGILIKKPDLSPGPHPVVIALHGTGGTKSDELPFLRQLAAKGFIAVAIDGPYHGERSQAGKGTADYESAILTAFQTGTSHPFYFDTVWDVMRLIDYLQTRPDIDPTRIGLYGVSKGGIETYLSAAIDPRISVAVPTISLESFKWALDHNAWQPRVGTIPTAFADAAKSQNILTPDSNFVHLFYTKVAPGLDEEFDGPNMVKLIAPRPLMSINGDSDPRTPLPSLQLCIDSAKLAYHTANADDHFTFIIQPHTAHKVTPSAQSAAIDWFAKWLKP
jgi:fermentation-respiration switch protein FrsA (DUF1100 family)